MVAFIEFQMDKEAFLELHTLLGMFEDYLARKSVPSNWSEPGIEEIKYLMQLVEKETPKLP